MAARPDFQPRPAAEPRIFPRLDIPETLAAGPGPGNTDPRVLEAYARAGVADHMQADVVRGMREAKLMLRQLFGTRNAYTYAVCGTGWSALDCAFSPILPGDKVVCFVNGTFSGLDDLNVRMKASNREDLAANPLDPRPANVVTVNVAHGESVGAEVIEAALAEHRPMWAVMAHFETGSGRVNDLRGFDDACARHDVMGIVDCVSSLGIADFDIDDYPAVTTWASCPQKGVLALPMTYAPISFSDRVIDLIRERGCPSYLHNPIFDGKHWGITDGADVDTAGYHRTHSANAVASFHEALRILLEHGRAQKAADYAFYEKALRHAVEAMGCRVTSNMPSLLVFDLPEAFAGREKEIVQDCRERGFAIWNTLSEPAQVRIGILNQLTPAAIRDIVGRFADAMLRLGAGFDRDAILADLDACIDGR